MVDYQGHLNMKIGYRNIPKLCMIDDIFKGFSKEVLYIPGAQRDARLQEVKIGNHKSS